MNLVEFQHEAMATTFALTIAGVETKYAQQAATAAWLELDRLENDLSRYVQSSDIARANRIACGDTLKIGDDTLACLLQAAEISIATGHVFDVAYASERSAGQSRADPAFSVDPDSHTLTSRVDRLRLDLGAIGKGFALDRVAELLADWEISTACLQSGGSTALVLAAPPDHLGWSIGIGDDTSPQSLTLSNVALSGSGIAVKGEHLIDPRTRKPAVRTQRAWALAPTAAASDALSTAFFVWSDQEIARFCERHPEIGGAIATSEGRLVRFGALATYPLSQPT
jgi:thiamine biosynthesis lipoprotein